MDSFTLIKSISQVVGVKIGKSEDEMVKDVPASVYLTALLEIREVFDMAQGQGQGKDKSKNQAFMFVLNNMVTMVPK